MARPSEFDRDEAIASAIKVFARHGFEAASTTDLLEGMGIGRQSLYGAFGDKRGLFLEALCRYAASSLAQMREVLAAGTPAEGIEAALLVGLGSSNDLESGCLGVGSVVEFSRSDPEINALNDTASMAVVAAFAARVRDGIEAGELDAGLDPDAAGRMLLVLRSGLKVAARGGASDSELCDAARLALRGLVMRR
ncbi:AcrR family transcriptional regulator [Bosea sp. BE271]|uniref:TetR/AcrR family transcriptional regulator n=1 Tax=Bosea TaxID=85413 RepID=UPI00285D3D45|nr:MULTISPECIES: TetR/AcrR family transcriptional regulator [Bosea]MDR6829007.1 AcrR family transcriptional regulator [Bosea robiniae]MDR6895891.1 AcrR family transcriptional regulator [Bosea sp. BE109]MDR7139288.1 AcrR family transcriptional regulator [Bosea sp. BE168]MDR7175987.1 AcrR family transcriptional regulator [Bosea sp. BE271]